MNAGRLDPQQVSDELFRLAEIASGMLDGEQIKGIVTPQAMHYIVSPEPQFRYMSGDYYDVEHDAFLATKKFLTRLERLGKVRLSGSVWVPVPGRDHVTVAVQNGPHHRYYRFGQESLETPAEMKEVFRTGRIVRVPAGSDDEMATVLAPARDSLGDVVGVIELTAPLETEAPAWS